MRNVLLTIAMLFGFSIANAEEYCTPPKSPIKIAASSGAQIIAKKNGKNVYSLSLGDSIVFSQESDITPEKSDWASPDFGGYKIAWFVGRVGSVDDAQPILNGTINDLVVSYNDYSLAGVSETIILCAVDSNYPDSQCWSADTVYIRYESVHDVPMPFTMDGEVCAGTSVDLKDLVKINTSVSDDHGYSLEYITSDGMVLPSTVINTDIANEGKTVLEYKVAQVSRATGSRSEYATVRITIHKLLSPCGDLVVLYREFDAVDGSFLTLLQQNPNVVEVEAGTELQWYDIDKKRIAEPAPPYIAEQTETYMYTYFVSSVNSVCISEPAKVTAIVFPKNESSIPAPVANSIVVYPNPAKNTVYIKYKDDAQVSIFDAGGRNVLNAKAQNGEVNIESLPSGTYYMTINNEVSTRVVKE